MNDLFDDTALTASWRLPAGRALSLRPRQAGRLQVCQGRVWATMDGPHGWREGDMFLAAGDSLRVPAGQHLVIEPRHGGAPAWFSWMPETAGVGQASWRRELAQPASELRLALRGAALALLRLAAGLARAFRAASSASRTQGAMG